MLFHNIATINKQDGTIFKCNHVIPSNHNELNLTSEGYNKDALTKMSRSMNICGWPLYEGTTAREHAHYKGLWLAQDTWHKTNTFWLS